MGRPLVLLLLLIAAGPAAAQESALASVSVDARLTPGETVSVAMRYRLEPRGAEEVFFSAVDFADGRAVNVRAFSGARELSFRRDTAATSRLDGVVQIPAGAAEDRWELRLEYEVIPVYEAVESGVVALPILVAGWPPEDATSGTFTAEVHLPAGVHLVSAFPATFESIAPVEQTDAGASYRFELPAVPSLIRLRLSDRPPTFTLESVVDLGTVGLLVFLGVVGWRRLRERWA